MESIGYVVLGLAAGMFSGLVGIGGGVLIVPALVFFFGMSQHTAQGTTVAMLVPPIGLMAAFVYYREGYVNIPAAAFIALGFILGSVGGAKVAVALPESVLAKFFGVVVVLVGLKMIVSH